MTRHFAEKAQTMGRLCLYTLITDALHPQMAEQRKSR